MAVNTTKFPARGANSNSASARKVSSRAVGRHPSDDEILGLVTAVAPHAGSENYEDEGASGATQEQNPAAAPDQSNATVGDGNSAAADASSVKPAPVPAELAPILAAHPQLREAWDVAHEYQQIFATPAAARDAQQQLTDLDCMFFSSQPADHAALAARIHELSPEAFHGLAQAIHAHAAKIAGVASSPVASASTSEAPAPAEPAPTTSSAGTPDAAAPLSAAPATARASAPKANVAQSASDPRRAAQAAFFHDTNAKAVEQILGAIQSQVDRLLPDSVGAGTRNRIVGEIYRELDAALRANHQLAKQLKETFQSGSGDVAHQRAIVTLLAGRARQALPAVAKRVIGEWTQGILAANRERLGRHEAASKRVDIAGAGPSDGVNRKPISPRDINYRKLSDADILNL